MEDDGHSQLPGLAEEQDGAGVIEQHPIAPFATDADAVHMVGRLQELGGMSFGRTGAVARDESVRVSVARLQDLVKGLAGVGPVRAHVGGTPGPDLRRGVLERRVIPGEQPGSADAEGVKFRDHTVGVEIVEADVVVRVDDHG